MVIDTAERGPSGSGRVIRLRHAGRCGCGAQLPAGTKARWDAGARAVTCLDCLNADDAAVVAVPEGSAAGTVIPPQPGSPGGAAGREHQRRKIKRDAETDALPFGLRKLARTVFDDPQHIRAWQSGERGEIAVAKVLSGLAADSILALHDRRIPRRRSNIDHIAIGPAGIYVIDAKRYVGQRVEVRSLGGLFSARRSELFVGGRRKTDLVNGLAPQVQAVMDAISEFGLLTACIVQPVLCFVDVHWAWLSGNLSVDGVTVVKPRGLKGLVQKAGPVDAHTRHQLHSHLAQRLPSMTRG